MQPFNDVTGLICKQFRFRQLPSGFSVENRRAQTVWRSGGEYCGWAPLPPGAVYDTASARFTFQGRRVEAGFDFGLNWAHFSFVLTRELGETPRPHSRREEEVIYNRTTVIHNYTVVSQPSGASENHPHIVNHGVEPSRVAAVRGRAVEPVHILDLRTPASTRNHERLDPRAGTLEVYRPRLKDRKDQ